MISSLLFVAVGLGILVFGGELLLRGAVGVATYFRLSPAVIGLTVVAAGTSVPELAVSAVAAFQGKGDITVGNVVGSNIANIGLILGLVALYQPIRILGNTVVLEYPVLALITVCFVLLGLDGAISLPESLFFLLAYVCFTAYLIRVVKKELTPLEKHEYEGEITDTITQSLDNGTSGDSIKRSITLTTIGIALLGVGAEVTVGGAVTLGQLIGLTDRVIGLTIIAVGTSLPEIVTSLVSSYRGRDDVAVGNIIGSCVFNILVILGLSGVVSTVQIAEEIRLGDNMWMLGLTALLFPLMRSGMIISRKEGFALLAIYVIYTTQLLLKA